MALVQHFMSFMAFMVQAFSQLEYTPYLSRQAPTTSAAVV